MILDRLALGGVLLLALSFGLGDMADTGPVSSVLLHGVRGLLPGAIALALLAAIGRRRWPAFPSSLALPAAAWLAALVLSAVLAPANRLEALSSLERPASGALLAWAVYDLTREPSRWRLIAQCLGFGGLLVALVGLAEASGQPLVNSWLATLHDGPVPLGDVPRISATLSHPNLAAMVLELTLPLLVAWYWTSARRWRAPLAAGALAMLLALVLTFSRAGIAAGAASLALMASIGRKRGERRRLVALGMTGLAVPLTLLWLSFADPGLDRRLLAGLDESSPAQPSRLVFWSVALEMQRGRPWVGIGSDNFRWQFASYSGVAGDHLGVHAHSQYLEAFADTGLLGVLTLGWLLWRLMRTAYAGVRSSALASDWPWRLAVFASLTAWLLHALVDDFERFWPTSVAFWLVAGLASREASDSQRLNSHQTSATTAITTSSTRMPVGLDRAAPPPPPPPKLTIGSTLSYMRDDARDEAEKSGVDQSAQ